MPRGGSGAQQVGHRRALVDEHPDVTLGRRQVQSTVQCGQRRGYVPARLLRECLEDQDLEDRCGPAARLRGVQQPVEESGRVVEG